MAYETSEIVLSMQDLREVTAYTAVRTRDVEIVESQLPADSRARAAIDAAWISLEAANAARCCVTARGRR